jgi:VCBS repeat protein
MTVRAPAACVALAVVLALGAGCGASPTRPHTQAAASGRVAGPSFAPPVSYATGRNPNALALADLNGDGKRDLVTANDGTVSVLWNGGGGRFGAREDIRGGGESVAVADLNRDGRPDFAVLRARARFPGCRGCGAVSVLFNRGGRFAGGGVYRAGTDASAVVAGDLDGDAVPDLAVANASGRVRNDPRAEGATGTVSVFRGRGDGTFLPRKDYAAGISPMSLALADLNGDGRLDVVTAGNEGVSSVLINRGDGSFRTRGDYDETTGPTWVVAGDLDGNGSQDLAVASNDWSDEVAQSGVTLEPAFVYAFAARADSTLGGRRGLLQTFGYTDRIEGLAAGDLNGDRALDLVAARTASDYGSGIVSVLTNDGGGRFPERLDFPVGRSVDGADFALAVGDLNGDGRADLATADSSTHEVTVRLSAARLCDVQDLTGQTVSVGSGYEAPRLSAARRKLAASHCRPGTIRRALSDVGWPRGHVILQKPAFGEVLPAGARVDLVVSRGRS